MIENDITLEELSQRTGVEARTLRSWVSEGLLAPPFKPGRGARYPASNADRALAVRLLKDGHGLSLAEISHRFVMATEDQIRQWARETSMTSVKPGSARAYLSGLKRRASTPADISSPVIRSSESYSSIQHMDRQFSYSMPQSSGKDEGDKKNAKVANIERLILQLERALENPAPRRSRGTIWTRIYITPDIEISIRGDLEPRERSIFEKLADQFRAILTGRTKNE